MAVGLAVVAVALCWVTTRILRDQLDQALAAAAFVATEQLVHPAPEGLLEPLVAGDPARYARTVNRYVVLRGSDGSALRALPDTAATLPVDTAALALARAGTPVWADASWFGAPVRVFYAPLVESGVLGERVVQVAASLAPVQAVLGRVVLALVAVVILGSVATFGGAWLLAGSAVKPVAEIIAQAEGIRAGGPEPHIVAHATTEEYSGLVEVLNGMLERLDLAFRTQRRLTADVSHELRTPLTALRGEIEVALRSERSPRDYQLVLRSALEEIERLTGMAEDLLLLTRAESRLVTAHRAPTDFDGIVAEALDRRRRRCEEKGLAVERTLGVAGAATLDARLVTRLVDHLVDNAVKFTPIGGRVRVTTARDNGDGRPGAVHLSVEDSGPGLTPDDFAHLFQPFYRADPARTSGTGTGLGLALARAIVQLHGGVIRARNVPGGGARFEVDLPLTSTNGDGA
jgi:two-component system OmpR family sensor kinase